LCKSSTDLDKMHLLFAKLPLARLPTECTFATATGGLDTDVSWRDAGTKTVISEVISLCLWCFSCAKTKPSSS
jgi:hypothetical protein